ncbi:MULTISPECIES: ketoacyl-ACP synthase III [Brevibacillus]|uniref:ketoacyl-ACP synthase III n=1 Tax=Brevibacillus TaxID=55080 RepID=UPI000B9C28EA|nr:MULTISPECIES: ketoacyl-ACP synthase III [Brevibacillus]RFB34077.1 ketoacyl-ACP synthase III [Brevibacillus sp. VP]
MSAYSNTFTNSSSQHFGPHALSSKARITAIGSYVPDKRLTNFDLEKLVETSDEWIVRRTGMRERRIAEPNQFTSDLCLRAVQHLQQAYDKEVEDVDFILVCTSTPDYAFPSVASQLQAKLSIRSAGALDLNATCAGFVYGLHMANSLISSGLHKKILVVAGETLSKVTDYSDRNTCVLFGDGAGAALVERDEQNPSFLHSFISSNGNGGIHLYRSGLSKQMGDVELLGKGNIYQNGRELYKWVVSQLPQGMNQLVAESNFSLLDVDWFVPHSANLRMIESICEKSGFPLERTLHSLEYFGNTSCATIPLALDMALSTQQIKQDDTAILYGFGGGLVQAASLVRLSLDTRKS